MNRAQLKALSLRWRNHLAGRVALQAAALGLIAALPFIGTSVLFAILAATVVAGSVAGWRWRRTPRPTPASVAAHLNRQHRALEESAALWLREPESLSLPERLQLRRLNAAWEAVPEPARARLGQPPLRGLTRPSAAFAAVTLALLGVIAWPRRQPANAPATAPASITSSTRTTPPTPPALRSALLVITPPAYLKESARRIEALDGEFAEGSTVRWELTMQGDVTGLSLEGSLTDPLVAQPRGDGKFVAEATLSATHLYRLAATRADGSRLAWPELHTLKVIRDQAPRLTWQMPSTARIVVEPSPRPVVTIQLQASDDYGVVEARLVMTVAKGSGEGVKFREREEPFKLNVDPTREQTYTRELDLKQLGLEPGDELYVHVVATDGKTPTPNRTRSETRFITLRGPDTVVADPGTAIAGVRLVPQYFRSQRQLIIDTEKLLAEKPSLSADTFRQRSEDIGIDQKLLRLRYGQFLGEEFDPESSGAAAEARGMEKAGQLRTGQRAELSRTQAVERVVEQSHNHSTTPTNLERPATFEEIRAPFVHNHDSTEAATLFESKTKASLRDVLAAMWEAEGSLRTAQPERALPSENHALELLKELQQADRVYVRRVGFESPPIKENERRLRGELDAIPKNAAGAVPIPQPDADLAALREGVTALAENRLGSLSPATTATVGRKLAAAAQSQPERFSAALGLWARQATDTFSPAERTQLQHALASLLPAGSPAPERPLQRASDLAAPYFNALENSR